MTLSKKAPAAPPDADTSPPLPAYELFICTIPSERASAAEVSAWIKTHAALPRACHALYDPHHYLDGAALRALDEEGLESSLCREGVDLEVVEQLVDRVMMARKLEEDMLWGRGNGNRELMESWEMVARRREWHVARKARERGEGAEKKNARGPGDVEREIGDACEMDVDDGKGVDWDKRG